MLLRGVMLSRSDWELNFEAPAAVIEVAMRLAGTSSLEEVINK